MVKLVSSSLLTFVHSSLLDKELDRVLFFNKRLERFVEKFRKMVYKNGIRKENIVESIVILIFVSFKY